MKLLFYFIIFNLFSFYLFPFRAIERENSSFDYSKFDRWLLVASFDKNNIPYFKFVEDGKRNWNLANPNIKEYAYDGDNAKAGTFSISKMKYYQYRGYNPLYTENQNNADSKMIKRFYFYRFSGKGAGFISLDNSLVAVDTYSKYVYIYGIPIRDKKLFGIDIPLEWGASDTNISNNGNFIPFYKYDPVGEVNEDGSVTLYSQYRNSFLDREKRYLPVFNNKSIYK